MKILLLSDIPPCENLTAGLVLSALVRFVPKESICFYIVLNPIIDIKLNPEFANIPMRLETKPNENWNFLPQRRGLNKLSRLITFAGEKVNEQFIVSKRIKDAIEFGKSQNVDRVWAVLQGQTTIRMAEAVAKGLEVPLHTHVWDPFSWWADAHALDRVTKNRVQKQFNKTIKASQFVATASKPMAELYHSEFGVNSVPVIASHPIELAKTPVTELTNDEGILIGMAGQFYASKEWECLIKMLECSNWRLNNKKVKLIVLGPQKPPGEYLDTNVKYLGWKDQKDAAYILSLCDILYCPYPFDKKLKEVSTFSFPSKFVLYLAAGRPIVFHGPDYASPTKYIADKQCGVVVGSLLPTTLYNTLENLINDRMLYSNCAKKAQEAFINDFTLNSLRECFARFIGCDELVGDLENNQHYLSSEDSKFKEIEHMISNRKYSSFSYVAHGKLILAKRNIVKTREWLRKKIVSRIPPFKRFYLEIDYYNQEVKRLNKIIMFQNGEVVDKPESLIITKSKLWIDGLGDEFDRTKYIIILSENNSIECLIRKFLLIDYDISTVYFDSNTS
ncbi:TPA: ATP-binding protein, partial [Vibrio mimicus]